MEDAGYGIPTEKHGEIYDRFDPKEDSSTRSYGGTGLGLSIVKKLLELMGVILPWNRHMEKGHASGFQLPYC